MQMTLGRYRPLTGLGVAQMIENFGFFHYFLEHIKWSETARDVLVVLKKLHSYILHNKKKLFGFSVTLKGPCEKNIWPQLDSKKNVLVSF